jgi:predicted nucleotidyltransferase component of viral defense system
LDFTEIRRHVIVALFSDEVLFERLVLKGGNALELVHQVISRGSVDVDLSIKDEFLDLAVTESRIFRALQKEFERIGYFVFDEHFEVIPPPTVKDDPWWGGYAIDFKLIERTRAEALNWKLMKMQIQAETIDARQGRKFTVEISKHEYCGGKVSAEMDGKTIYVYTEEMCAIEKLRAICQQMPEYGRKHRVARARDFYDVYQTVTQRGIDLALPENMDLFRQIFDAKRVPLKLLARIDGTYDSHESDWAAVAAVVPGEVHGFRFYFDFVVAEISKLEALWKE